MSQATPEALARQALWRHLVLLVQAWAVLQSIILALAVHSGWRLFMTISVRCSSCHLSEPNGRMNVTQNGSDLEKRSMLRRFLAERDSSSTDVAAGPAVPGANVPKPGANPDPKGGADA